MECRSTNAPRAWWTECFDLEKEKFSKRVRLNDPLLIELNAKIATPKMHKMKNKL